VEEARPATAADIDAITALAHEMHEELLAMRGGELWALHDARSDRERSTFDALLGAAEASLWVGTITGVVVGFGSAEVVTLHDGRLLGVVRELIVTAEAREVGVGEAILDALVAWCRERRCIGVDAFALPGHRSAKNFFEGAHFTARGLLMHRPLDR
jgi:GNAT superfamily N-acetyltransferase